MKAKILQKLRASADHVSGQQLCEQFGVSRTAVWKAIKQLKEEGYDIEAVQNKGYRIKAAPDTLSKNELESLRKTTWIGQRIESFTVTGSTNTEAMQLGEQGAPHGTLVVADRQESGKGRRGRVWQTPGGVAIAMSILLRPDIAVVNAPMLTIVAALSVAKGIADVTGLDAEIKWPNDIVLHGKKLVGILTEMSTQIDCINYIVVGIGINVHNTEFAPEIAQTATSIFLESGVHYNRALLVEKICEAFEEYYALFLRTQDLSELADTYNKMLANLDREVCVLDPQGEFDGIAKGINERGELLVETKIGVAAVSSGEVSVRGIYGYV